MELRGLGAAAAGAALKLVEFGRTSQWSVVDQLVTTGDPEELTVAVREAEAAAVDCPELLHAVFLGRRDAESRRRSAQGRHPRGRGRPH